MLRDVQASLVIGYESPHRSLTDSTGFQWGDAGIGAGFTLGALLLIGGVGAGLLVSRKNRRRVAHA